MKKYNLTCGPLFSASLNHFAAQWDGDPVKLFSAGHMTGQAEKVYLGACPAAMFRPSPEYRSWALSAASYLANVVYGLEVSTFDRKEIQDEIWVHRTEHTDLVHQLATTEFNSPAWHAYRGVLCGVPLNEIDHEFHLRRGFGERCDDLHGGHTS